MTITVLGVGVYLTWYTGAPREVVPVAETRANQAVVPMANFAFAPTTTVIPVGGTVVWVNQDRAPHTATADNAELFSSDLVSAGQSFSHTFDAAGDFSYFCEL